MGRVQRAAVGDEVGRVGDLKWRRDYVTLADAHVVRIAFEPRLVFVELLPGWVGNRAILLAADVETGAGPVTKGTGVFRQTINPEAFEQRFVALLIPAPEVEEVDVR